MSSRFMRPPSPTRRSGAGSDYESYYRDPRASFAPRPIDDRRGPAHLPPPASYRDLPPTRRAADDYLAPSRRRAPSDVDSRGSVARRPVSIVVGSGDRDHYAPSSVAENPARSRLRADDDPYYLQPSSSTARHRRHGSAGHDDLRNYMEDREPRYPGGGYRGLAHRNSVRGPPVESPAIRVSGSFDDRNPGYEYTSMKDQAYLDTAPRPRVRRGTDAGPRERPHSFIGMEDLPTRGHGSTRDAGPPTSTRGLSRLQADGSVRHEYRVSRDEERGPRDSALLSARPDPKDDLNRRRSLRVPASHQDYKDGYSSNVEDRRAERHHRHHHRNGSDNFDSSRGLGIRGADQPRREERSHHKTRHEVGPDSPEQYVRRQRGSRDSSPDGERQRRPAEAGRSRVEESDRERRRKDRDRREPDATRSRGDESDRERRRKERSRRELDPDRARIDEEDDRERVGKGRERDSVRVRDEDHKSASRRDRDDDRFEKSTALGAAAVGAAGLAAAQSGRRRRDKDSSDLDSDTLPARRHRRDRRHTTEDNEADQRPVPEGNSSDERRERRRHRRDEVAHVQDSNNFRGDALGAAGAASVGAARVSAASHDYDGEEYYERRPAKEYRDRAGHRGDYDANSENEDEDDSDPRGIEYRPSNLRVVSPARDADAKPKGILRKPKEKFPEDPAPIREGVAPLNQAGKKGVPPSARWTKIDRRLVNPDALAIGNERFEERTDYVIVLRVLSKEEIEKYAELTQAIREHRAEETPEDRERSGSVEEAPRQIENGPSGTEADSSYHSKRHAEHDTRDTHAHRSHEEGERPDLGPTGSYHRLAPPGVSPPSSLTGSNENIGAGQPVSMPMREAAPSKEAGQGQGHSRHMESNTAPSDQPVNDSIESASNVKRSHRHSYVPDPTRASAGDSRPPVPPGAPPSMPKTTGAPPSMPKATMAAQNNYPSRSNGYVPASSAMAPSNSSQGSTASSTGPAPVSASASTATEDSRGARAEDSRWGRAEGRGEGRGENGRRGAVEGGRARFDDNVSQI